MDKLRPLDTLGRATGAEACLRAPLSGPPLNGGRSNNPETNTQRGVSPAGHGGAARFIAELGLDPSSELAKAHLIAADYGGSGINMQNIVSTWQKEVNLASMKVVENRVRDAVSSGQTVHLLVIPRFAGNSMQPWAIEYSAAGVYADGSPGSAWTVPVLNVKDVNGQAVNLGLR